MKVLIAEDDTNIRAGLIDILKGEGYETFAAANGTEALALFVSERPDFICLDIMMPGKSGYDVCREIRKTNETIPIVFITAKSEEIDKVVGLELGADDFITKPFGVKEVIARIRAVSRRCNAMSTPVKTDTVFCLADLMVAPLELRAWRGNNVIELSLREMRLLRLLYDNAGQAVTRDQIFNECWGLDFVPNSRTLDQHIAQLRKRIEQDPKNPQIIQTVHGVGYRYEKGD
ncbi:MAG: response regulator transcription factor [Deltaproteobacteria bacterium]|nr:response regulator transcription factor [Deltaproteobacteria bacterium]